MLKTELGIANRAALLSGSKGPGSFHLATPPSQIFLSTPSDGRENSQLFLTALDERDHITSIHSPLASLWPQSKRRGGGEM